MNKPHRADRRWSKAWSPEQISNRLKLDFPDDESMRVSHETIYQSLFIEGRGALKRELVTCLRTGRALRRPRERSRNEPEGHVRADVVISRRPAEAADRAVPGHWEGDLIIGTGRSGIGTLVERHGRATILVHLPRLEGHGEQPRTKNGPSLAGYGAEAMNTALTASITTLPQQLRKTITWDRGKELSAHVAFKVETGIPVFFCDPAQPVAARQQREHQRPPAPVPAQGHQPVHPHPARPRQHRVPPQQPPPTNPRIRQTKSSPRQTTRRSRRGTHQLTPSSLLTY